jgi:hypothetical protein
VCSNIVPVGSGTKGQEPQHQQKQLLGMEPIKKRQKLANEQQRSLLIDQPDLFLKFVVPFWDFQSLLAFRQTNHRFKRIAEEDLKRRNLEALPLDGDSDGERSDRTSLRLQCSQQYRHFNGESSHRASLRLEWSEKFRDRDAVFEYALARADPRGTDADYDEDRARFLIHSRGWVDVEDFLSNRDTDVDEAEEIRWRRIRMEYDAIGWRVSASFQSISPENKWNKAKALLRDEEDESMFEDEKVDGPFSRQCAFGLLLDAQPSSLGYAYAKHEYRHAEFPAGGHEEALLFLTSDGTQVQLKHSNRYQVY